MNNCEMCLNNGGLDPQNISDLFIYQHKCKLCVNNPNLADYYEE